MNFGIALGSNLGDRAANIQRGIELLLTRVPGIKLTASAPIYETDPVDCPEGSLSFYNSVIEIEAACDAHALHRVLQSIEQDLGRRGHRHPPRPAVRGAPHRCNTHTHTQRVSHTLHTRARALRPSMR